MLRIIPQASSAVAKSYYTAADYYVDGQELAGVWGGRGAALLGLTGTVEKADFDRLCDNRDPRDGSPLTAHTKAARRVLYDFNFHVPKSVTLAYELTGDDRVLNAFRAAVDETMWEAESEMKARVRASGRSDDRVTGNMVYATFVHRTARPSKQDKLPDPHLHAHVCVFNATLDGVEGKWKAGQFGDLKRDAPYWQAGFHARLGKALTDLGFGVTRTKAGWELTGVPTALVKEFSRRTAEVEALAAMLGVTDPKTKDGLGATSRSGKVEASVADLRAYWQGRLTPEDRAALDAVAYCARTGTTPVPTVTAEAAVRYAADHLFERHAAVPEKRFYAEALNYGVGGVTVADLRAEATRQGIFTAELDGILYASSLSVLKEEQRLLAFARSGRGTRPPIEPGHEFVRDWLDAGQRRAVRHVLESSDRVLLIRGAAGTGKTSLMQEAVEAVEAAGQPVVVLAPSAEASRDVLRREGFAGANTVAAFLLKSEFQESARGGVIWVDEAGLLGVADLARLCDAAGRLDARVVLQGDSYQHGSVARGPALKLLETHAGLPSVQVTDVKRQKGAYREAVQTLSRGDTAEGLEKLDALGWVREVADDDRDRTIAADFLAARGVGQSVLVVSPTHAEGETVTQAIRDALRTNGELGEEREFVRLRPLHLTEAERGDPVNYHPGDVLHFVKNARGRRSGTRLTVSDPPAVPTSDAGKFQVYRPEQMQIAIGDRLRVTAGGKTADGKQTLTTGLTFDVAGFTRAGDILTEKGWVVSKGFGHLSHGYVATSHASQGKTVDRVLVAQSSQSFPASGREQFYVSVSRGRQQATIYTDHKGALADAIRRADRRVSATDLLPEARQSPVRALAWQEERSRLYRAVRDRVVAPVREWVAARGPAFNYGM